VEVEMLKTENSFTDDKPPQQKPARRWRSRHLYMLQVLICIPIFYQINKFLWNYYLGWARVEFASYEFCINLAIILMEIYLLAFWFCVTGYRWCRCCLHTLLFLVMCSAIAYIIVMQPAWKQKATVETIKKWGEDVVIHNDSPDYSLDPQNCRYYPRWLRDLFGDDYFYKVWSVQIRGSDLTNINLTPLEKLEYLDDIYIHNSQIIDRQFEQIIRLPKLDSLSLDGCNITNEMLARISNIKNLQPKLRLLSLENTKITDKGLGYLNNFKKLKWLYLDQSDITDDGILHLKGLSELNLLSLKETKITDSGLMALKYFPKIYELRLRQTKITDAGIVHLKSLPHLEILDLGETDITDEGLKDLDNIINLGDLAIDHTKVTDKGLTYIKGLTNLRSIFLFNTNVTEKGIKNLQEKLPKLSIIQNVFEDMQIEEKE
jgi:internalin A